MLQAEGKLCMVLYICLERNLQMYSVPSTMNKIHIHKPTRTRPSIWSGQTVKEEHWSDPPAGCLGDLRRSGLALKNCMLAGMVDKEVWILPRAVVGNKANAQKVPRSDESRIGLFRPTYKTGRTAASQRNSLDQSPSICCTNLDLNPGGWK